MTRPTLVLLAPLLAAACAKDQEQIGDDEPFRIHTADNVPAAQFKKGPLPGLPPLKTMPMTMAPAPSADAGKPTGGPPQIVDFSTFNPVYQGQGSVPLSGSATENSFSVALGLEGIGTGYWVIPVADVDVMGNRDWSASGDFDSSIPSGYRNLIAVAIDESNQAGRQAARRICIAGSVPDNFNSCDPKYAPPFAVISLSWDANADLDLQVQTPNGRLIDPKSPLITLPNDAGALPKIVDGIDRDSNAACVVDGIRRENLVFRTDVPHGLYGIYVNMFDACKQPAVRFRVEIYSSEDLEDGGKHLVRYYPRPEDPQGGELLDISANGGTARGLFVTEFKFK